MMKLPLLPFAGNVFAMQLDPGVMLLAKDDAGLQDHYEWDLCDSTVYSNLGGYGPHHGAEEAIRFSKVLTTSDETDETDVDLLVTNMTRYKPYNASMNTNLGCVGYVNLLVSSDVVLKFQWVESGTTREIEQADYLFSLFDIDKGGQSTEVIQFVTGVGHHWIDSATFAVTGSAESGLTFIAEEYGYDDDDNTVDPTNLTTHQLKTTGTVLYQNVSSFTIKFSADGGSNAGRNFGFGGWSQLVPTIPSPPPNPVVSTETQASRRPRRSRRR